MEHANRVSKIPVIGFAVIAAIALNAVLLLTGCEEPKAPHKHQWGEWEVTLPATCVATGEETRVCKLDSTHIEKQEIAIDPNAHDWDFDNAEITDGHAPTCIAKGSGTLNCKNGCGQTNTNPDNIPIDLVNGHDWNDWGTTPTPATETENGYKTRVCKNSNAHTENEFTGEYATGTTGLNFVLISPSNTAYRVSKGTAIGDIFIPAYYRPDADSEYFPVTQISNGTNSQSNNAFGGTYSNPNTTVTSITFAAESPLTTIGNYAFYYCTSLTDINIPATVTSIGTYAFYSCTSLTSITVDANNPNYASEGGIVYNKAKTVIVSVPPGISGNVTIPTGVTSIGSSEFAGCTGLTGITIPDGVTSIGDNAFAGCTSLASITLPDSLESIGQLVFQHCTSLTSITIPEGVTSIGYCAFEDCTGLTSVTIPASVTSIGYYAFQHCTSLTSITIPAGVTSISWQAFSVCTSLASVTFNGTIASDLFDTSAFYGDLRDKFYATNSANGTPGTYTTTAPVSSNSVWTKQP